MEIPYPSDFPPLLNYTKVTYIFSKRNRKGATFISWGNTVILMILYALMSTREIYTKLLNTLSFLYCYYKIISNIGYQKHARNEDTRTFCLHAMGSHSVTRPTDWGWSPIQVLRDIHSMYIASKFYSWEDDKNRGIDGLTLNYSKKSLSYIFCL